MNLSALLMALYVREFNQEYLSTAADRRQFGETLINGLLTVLLIIATAVVFLMT